MDEKLEQLLNDARGRGFSIQQLQEIVNAYNAKKKSNDTPSQKSIESTPQSSLPVTPKAAPSQLGGGTETPIGGFLPFSEASKPIQKNVAPFAVGEAVQERVVPTNQPTPKASIFGFERYKPTPLLVNGQEVNVDERTLPILPYKNGEVNFVNTVNEKLAKSQKLNPLEETFLKKNLRPIMEFNQDDDKDLNDIAAANGLSLEQIQSFPIPDMIGKLIPSLAGKTIGEVANTDEGRYAAIQEIKTKLQRELAEKTKYDDNGAAGTDFATTTYKRDNVGIKKIQQQLADLEMIDKKVSKNLAVSSQNALLEELGGQDNAVVRTDQSGSKMDRLVNWMAKFDTNPFTNPTQDASYRIEKLPEEAMLGLNYIRYKEPVKFERFTRSLMQGKPISETELAQITQIGVGIAKNELNKKSITGEVDEKQYSEKSEQLKTVATNNILNNPEVIRGFLASEIAELADADNIAKEEQQSGARKVGNRVFGHRWNYDDAEIMNYAAKIAKANDWDINDKRILDAVKYLQKKDRKSVVYAFVTADRLYHL